MQTILYGDAGSERMLFADETVTSQEISDFYQASYGIMAGYQYRNNDDALWYYVCKYNSRGGGYLSGVLDRNTCSLPCVRIQNIPFHTINEFENENKMGSERIGENDAGLSVASAEALLSTLFQTLSSEGKGQILYLTIGDWRGSGDGFVKTALSIFQRILKVLPIQLQLRLSFSVNTNLSTVGILGHHVQLQFLMPHDMHRIGGHVFDFSSNAEERGKCHPYLQQLAQAAADNQEFSTLEIIENSVVMPSVVSRAYPMQLYLDLYDFLQMLESYDPFCSDEVFSNLCDQMERRWMRLRQNKALNKNALFTSLKTFCHIDLLNELAEIEQKAVLREKNLAHQTRLLEEKKAELQKRISAKMNEKNSAEEEKQAIEDQIDNYKKENIKMGDDERNALEFKNLVSECLKKRKGKEEKLKKRVEVEEKNREADKPKSNAQLVYEAFEKESSKKIDYAANAFSELRKIADNKIKENRFWSGLNFPKHSQGVGNTKREIKREAFTKIVEKNPLNKKSTIEDRIEKGDLLFYKMCSNLLSEYQNYKCFQFIYSNHHSFNIDSIEIILPMLGCQQLIDGELSPEMRELYTMKQKLYHRVNREDVYFCMTMYFALAYCGFCLSAFVKDKKALSKNKQSKIIKDMKLDEFMSRVVKITPNEEFAKRTLEDMSTALQVHIPIK